MSTSVVDIAYEIVSPFEGMHRLGPDGMVYPYLCPAQVPTIGEGSTYYLDGKRVTMQDPPITITHAKMLSKATLGMYLEQALLLSPVLAGHPYRWAAIGSFCQNCGPARYRASTLRRRVNSQDWAGAAEEIKKWNRGGGRVLPGLTRRRAVEAAYLLRVPVRAPVYALQTAL